VRWIAALLLLGAAALAEPLIVVQEGHRGPISAAAFRPGGKILATGGHDGLVKLWEVESGRLLLTLPPPHGRPTGLVWARDGQHLVVGQINGEARVWDVESQRMVAEQDFRRGGYCGVAVSADGKWFACGADEVCSVRALADGAERFTWKGPERDRFLSVAFTPDGTHLAAAGDEFVYLWRLSDGTLARRLSGFPGDVVDVAFRGDELVTRVRDGPVELWDWRTGRRLGRVAQKSAQLAVDGETIAIADAEGALSLGFRTAPGPLALQGRRLMAGAELWDVEEKQRTHPFDPPSVRARKVAGSRLLVEEGEALRVWDWIEDRTIRILPGGRTLALSPDGTHLAIDARVIDLATGEAREVDAAIRGATALAPGGKRLAWRADADDIRIEGGRRFPGNSSTDVLGLAFSTDGRLLLQSGKGEFFAAYDIESGERLRRNERGAGWIVSMALSSDGKRLLCGGPWSSITLRDEAFQRIHTLDGHRGSVPGTSFLDQERKLATVGSEGDLRVWDAATGAPLLTMHLLVGGGWIALAPDGRYDASADAGKRCAWAEPGLALAALESREPVRGLVASVCSGE